jgi:hypothetical protein
MKAGIWHGEKQLHQKGEIGHFMKVQSLLGQRTPESAAAGESNFKFHGPHWPWRQ